MRYLAVSAAFLIASCRYAEGSLNLFLKERSL
jgi:hypothetical protein